MSNSLAIGAVTATLRSLLEKGISGEAGGLHVTTLPPDRAQTFGQGDGAGRVNLFLYHTQYNAAWRNTDMPRQIRPNETGQPPVALDLYYLLTAYEKTDGDPSVLAHRLLGRAMRALHDHPLLGAEEIRSALQDNDLADQVERVRITPQPLSLEELSKLWMIFQTGYRISTAYQVSVVLIESLRASRAPLPVLTRGEEDRGVTAVAGANLPIIENVRPPNRQSSVLLGDELAIIGPTLNDVAAVRFTLVNPSVSNFKPILISLTAALDTEDGIKVTLPDDAAASTAWIAGFYTVAVAVNRNKQTWSSNELPISLAPRIDAIAPPSPIARDGTGHVTLTVSCSPQVRLANLGNPLVLQFAQRVVLLLEPFDNPKAVSLSIAPVPPTGPAPPSMSTNTLQFVFPIPNDRTGGYLVRLRVDGIDLPLVDWKAKPPKFDAKQKVTIT